MVLINITRLILSLNLSWNVFVFLNQVNTYLFILKSFSFSLSNLMLKYLFLFSLSWNSPWLNLIKRFLIFIFCIWKQRVKLWFRFCIKLKIQLLFLFDQLLLDWIFLFYRNCLRFTWSIFIDNKFNLMYKYSKKFLKIFNKPNN